MGNKAKGPGYVDFRLNGFTFHCLRDFYQRHESRYKIYLHKNKISHSIHVRVDHEGNRTALHVVCLLKMFLES